MISQDQSKENFEVKNLLELKVLYEVTWIINSNLSFNSMLNSVYEALHSIMGINDLVLLLEDEETSNLEPVYSKSDLILNDFKEQINSDKRLRQVLLEEKSLCIKTATTFMTFKEIDSFILRENAEPLILMYPVIDNDNLFGLVCFYCNESIVTNINLDYIMDLAILAIQISTAIINDKLKNRILSVASISMATKDIAKIIETQYELGYVLPIMGEIMDKYLSNALIYIFLKNQDDDNFDLSWPGSYSKKSIDPLLEKIKQTGKMVVSDNKYALAIPMFVGDKLFGVIVADAKVVEIDSHEIDLLKEFSKQAIATIHRSQAYAETVKHATIDALTGLDNRRQLDKRLMQESSIVMRTKRPLSILMMDIDYFKRINDTHGHSVGDYVLFEVAKLILATKREYDIAGRYGGEEFTLLLPDTNLEGAKILAERLRELVEKTVFNIGKYASSKSETISLTLSIGIAVFDSDCKNPADLYEEADIALYRAKQDGRNKVVTFTGG